MDGNVLERKLSKNVKFNRISAISIDRPSLVNNNNDSNKFLAEFLKFTFLTEVTYIKKFFAKKLTHKQHLPGWHSCLSENQDMSCKQ